MLFSVFVAASVQATSIANQANPVVLAERGLVQCYRPDIQKKTCQSIASYRATGSGTYDNFALVPLTANASLETRAPVVVKAGAVCGFIRTQDVLAGTLRIGGAAVEPTKAKPILERAAQAMASMADKEICTRYLPAGSDFTAKISIDGNYLPELDTTVKWISAADGYTVMP